MYSLFFRGQMQPLKENIDTKIRSYDYGLEGLRGLAALWVGYAHIFNFENLLDPNFHPKNNYLADIHASHGAVLIFFILSGYVIGLTNTKKCNKPRIFNYLIRRFIRLFPIYLIAIVISILVVPPNNWQIVIGNLFFLQPAFVKVLSGNPILWTLNYEVVYYILFLLIWYYKPKSQHLLLGALTIAIVGWIFPGFPQIISAYASGWIFWIFGLLLAWRIPPSQSKSKIPLFSYCFLLFATNHFSSGKILLNGLGLVNKNVEIINLADLLFLPICFLIVSSISGRIKYKTILEKISIAIPLFTAIFLAIIGRTWSNQNWEISTLFTLFALVIWFWKQKLKLLHRLSYFGSISYGFYVLHMPIMYFMNYYFPFSGSPSTFIIRVVIWLLLTIVISNFLELIVQPKIKLWSKQKLLIKLSYL